MAASRGVDNWNRNWKGQGDISSMSKVDSGILYEENGNRVDQTLTRGTPVTYIDGQSKSHTRVAVRVGEDVFFTNVFIISKIQKKFKVRKTAKMAKKGPNWGPQF